MRLKRMSNVQVIALGFLALIAAGTLLLCLPIATRDGQGASLKDALFTATSASCVTGLVVQDTAVYWTGFGQIIILSLIQIGGMGFMTIATMLLLVLRQRVGIRNRERMIESISTADSGSILPLTRKIFIGTIAIEIIGALVLSIRFIPMLGWSKGLWYGLFHSISAFCNAGFDLMGPFTGPYSSLTSYANDPLVVLVMTGLITLGGLGYWVWDDLWHNRFHWKRYRLQTKLVLTISAVLTIAGTLLFWLLERENMAGQSAGEQALRSLFNAVTPRTAGFSTTDAATLTEGSKLLTILYMFIGGSPGSTAGGIKTTTFAVLVLYVFAEITHRREVNAFGRHIRESYHRRAASIALYNLLLAITAGLLLCALHSDLPLSDILLETFSAMGTVGMSTGITRQLGDVCQIILIVLMYLGRVGSISFSLAIFEKRTRPPVSQPAETVIIG